MPAACKDLPYLVNRSTKSRSTPCLSLKESISVRVGEKTLSSNLTSSSKDQSLAILIISANSTPLSLSAILIPKSDTTTIVL